MARVNEMTDMATIVEIMEVSGALKGKSFSITGHLGRKREDIVKIIEMAGGTFHKEPGFGTAYLITNADWTARTARPGASKKFDKARRNGTKIISEAQFYELISSGAADEEARREA